MNPVRQYKCQNHKGKNEVKNGGIHLTHWGYKRISGNKLFLKSLVSAK